MRRGIRPSWLLLGACAVLAALQFSSCSVRSDQDSIELGSQLKRLSDTQDAFAAVARIGRDFVVSITVREETSRSFLDYFFQSPEKVKGGSGLVVHENGWVLTNRHVVEGADKITIRFADGRTLKATDVLAGKNTDLAFVKVPSGDLRPAPLGDSDKIRVGDWAIAIGSPFGFDQTVTVGIVSARGRKLRGGRRGQYETFIQTDAAINSGNSGGPLLNIKGEVIGVNTAIYSHTNSYIGIGFAIPINRAKKLLGELLEKYGKSEVFNAEDAEGGYLGVNLSELNPAIKNQLGLANGVVIDSVVENGPAARAGLRRYDILTSVGGRSVDTIEQMAEIVRAARPGTVLDIGFVRGNQRFRTRVTVGKRP
jgi:serine protease Do